MSRPLFALALIVGIAAPASGQALAPGFVAMSDAQLATMAAAPPVPLRRDGSAHIPVVGIEDLTLARSAAATQMDQWWFEDGGELLADAFFSQMTFSPIFTR